MNRPALIISILLTALVLTIAGGVAYSVHNIQVAKAAQVAQAAQANNTAAQDVQVAADQQAVDPQLQQTMLDREAAYQKMIAEANARLAQDQQTMQALQTQVAALQNPAPADPMAASASASGVSPQNAAKIAEQYLSQTDVYSVETAAYNGANVYKVTFSSGDVVMVSFTGQILAVQPAARQGSSGQVASHSGEHEHEGGDD